jgi:xanthine dehydrogenase iron-sulfur cluster and FAD-binding subunit A
MWQEIVVVGLFIGALLYLVQTTRRLFSTRKGCAKGCGTCHVIEAEKMIQKIEQ